MPIQFTIPDELLTIDERTKLREVFAVADDAHLDPLLERAALSAFIEYKEMFLGMSMPTRADEIKQHRLLHLTKHLFTGRIPSEAEVAILFQLTPSQSRSLVRNILTRFRFILEEEIHNSLIEAIQSAQPNEETHEYLFVSQSETILEELNKIIERIAPQLDPISKVRNTASTFSVSDDTYTRLRHNFDLD